MCVCGCIPVSERELLHEQARAFFLCKGEWESIGVVKQLQTLFHLEKVNLNLNLNLSSVMQQTQYFLLD